jgi:hypothetical protein
MFQKYFKSDNLIILGFIFLLKICIITLAYFSVIRYNIIYLILPSVITMFIDRSNDKCLFISIAFFNLSGILLTITKPVINKGLDISSILVITLKSITSIYMLSALGLCFYFLMPLLFRIFNAQLIKIKRSQSKAKIKIMEQSWNINS